MVGGQCERFIYVKPSEITYCISHLNVAERTQVFLHPGTLTSRICLSSIKKKR